MQTEELKALVVDALEEVKANDISVLDVRGKTSVTDFMVIASGTSNRHVKSLADHIVETAKKNGCKPLGKEGEESSEWVLIDLGDVIAHVMLPSTRQFYDLEKLWQVDVPAEAAD